MEMLHAPAKMGFPKRQGQGAYDIYTAYGSYLTKQIAHTAIRVSTGIYTACVATILKQAFALHCIPSPSQFG